MYCIRLASFTMLLPDQSPPAAQLADQWEGALHTFLEECDSPQGFQVLVDTDGGFGGLASGLLDSIRDNHGNKPVLTFALGEAGSAPTAVWLECGGCGQGSRCRVWDCCAHADASAGFCRRWRSGLCLTMPYAWPISTRAGTETLIGSPRHPLSRGWCY
jgi:hypothetical protein